MSLRLKGRKVYLKGDYRADGKIMNGIITDDPIYVKVRLESGNVATLEEKDIHFDLKKKGKGK